jgi:hypothetical protein
MRPLSFLFAALLGVVLAMIAPAIAGTRPDAPLPEATTLAWAAEAVAPAAAASEAAPAEAASQPASEDEGISVEEISRSILDTINALSDAA